MLPAIIAQIGMPVLTNVLGRALGRIDDPLTKAAADALSEVDAALRRGQIRPEDMAEANRHAEKMLELEFERNTHNLSEINKSLRAEIASNDVYVRRMRPTFGYLMAVTWAAQMLGIAYVIIFKTAQAGVVLNAMSSLSAIWAVGLSVLGIYVYKRSEEKRRAGGFDHIIWNSPRVNNSQTK